MRKIHLFVLGLAALFCIQVNAYDFSSVANYVISDVTNQVELYYSINSDETTVTLTKGPDTYEATYVNIPETVEYNGKTYTVTSIGYEAFANSNISTVLMPNTIEEIQNNAFHCSSIDSVSFSKGLKTIGDGAFSNAEDLTSVVLYEGLEKIGNYAFSTGGYYNHPGLRTVVLPNSLNDIGENAFWYQLNLNYVKLPDGLKRLKSQTFYYCPSLKEITLPETLEVIGESAFEKTGVTTIHFPASLKEIGESAFSGCNLVEVTIPDNVETVGKGAFGNNGSLVSISFSNKQKTLPEYVCGNCTQLVNVNIPEGITTIESSAFKYCERLSSVAFPESVTTLGNAVFYCSGITRFSFPSNITEIPDMTFASCEYLSSVSIQETIKSIGASAFSNCINLGKVEIPETVMSIGNEAFDGCSSLEEINLPAQLTTISQYMFRGCESLSSVELPESIKDIQGNAFRNCYSLKEIELPENLETIETCAFCNCTSLSKITIPHSTTVVGAGSFGDCSNLTELHIQRALLPTTNYAGSSDIKIVGYDNICTLYVPRGAKATYEASSVWNNFMVIEEEDVPDVYYQIGASVSKGNGSVEIDDNNIVYDKAEVLINDRVVVTFIPAEGYMLEYVFCNGEDITDEIDEYQQWNINSVEANYVLEVGYKEKPVVLHLASGQGGSIDIEVEKYETFKCNFQPEEGWSVNAITLNGRDVTTDWDIISGYTTPKLTTESTLSVSFEQSSTSVGCVNANAVKALAIERGVLSMEGLATGELVEIYTTDGVLVSSFIAENSQQAIILNTNTLYIVKTNSKTIKVAL